MYMFPLSLTAKKVEKETLGARTTLAKQLYDSNIKRQTRYAQNNAVFVVVSSTLFARFVRLRFL